MRIRKRVSVLTQRGLSVLCSLALFLAAGCASSYDCYTCGRVCCNYCPPSPMPAADYRTCNCSDSIGQAYLSNMSIHGYATNVPISAENLENARPVFEPQDEAIRGKSSIEDSGKSEYP